MKSKNINMSYNLKNIKDYMTFKVGKKENHEIVGA